MHRDARAVEGFFNDLASRIGSVPREAQLPRAHPATEVASERAIVVVSHKCGGDRSSS